MSSRMFQGVVLQMKDGIDRVVGVIDADGIVVACSELTSIGEHWSGAVAAINAADNGITRYEGKTFKPLAGWGAQFDYAAFVQGEDPESAALCAMAVVAFNGAKTSYEEKHDKATFVKNIISDNILLGTRRPSCWRRGRTNWRPGSCVPQRSTRWPWWRTCRWPGRCMPPQTSTK